MRGEIEYTLTRRSDGTCELRGWVGGISFNERESENVNDCLDELFSIIKSNVNKKIKFKLILSSAI